MIKKSIPRPVPSDAPLFESGTSHYRYISYGICLQTPFPCPELKPAQGEPDVLVYYGRVPEALEAPDVSAEVFQANATQFLLKLERVAYYLAQNGNEIIIQRAEQAADDEVRTFLLGSTLSALLHQRGVLALHASAIRIPKGAVLFLGPSGAGKSTLLGAFLARGYTMLADDVIAIALDKVGRPVALPSYPQMKLWADAAEKLGRSTDSLRRLHPSVDKYAVPTYGDFISEPVPLYALYALETHDDADLSLAPLKNIEKLSVFIENTYRPLLLAVPGLRQRHFQVAAAAANVVRVRRVLRPRHSFLLDEMVQLIEDDLS